MDLISIIVPCYNEEESLPLFFDKICRVLEKMLNIDYELIFIDDGSNDSTLYLLKNFSLESDKSRYISFSRNFGKEAAMYAGLRESKGDYVSIMDADLQHPPELLPEMYQALKDENFDCACAVRKDRTGEAKIRSYLSTKFYAIINRISKTKTMDGAGDYRMMCRIMADSVIQFKEYNRYSKGLFAFVGFKTKWIPYHNTPRAAGNTKWSFSSLFRYAMDGTISFSSAPLVLSSYCGIIFCIIAIVMAVYTAFKTLIFGNPTSGWTTLVCILLLIGGLQMLFIGIVGQYISKTYLEVKQRPIYIVKETNINPSQ